jgi:predicted MFS family arabinose efflux permease
MTQLVPSMEEEAPRLSGRQWLLLLVLAAVQFTHVVDFMIIMPLAPKLMHQDGLGLGPEQYSRVVSVFGLAACLAGLVLAPLVDHFDRKWTLLGLYAGFGLGTLVCALAPSYGWLLAGRAVAGAFGGIAGATVLAIIGDAYPDRRRGLATGVVMSAFSVASIIGVPAGLFLAGEGAAGWRAPFLILAAGCGVVLLLSYWAIPRLRTHLDDGHDRPGLWEVISRPAHMKAYGLMLSLVFGGFLIGPYLALYLVQNVGLSESRDLPQVYFFGGLATLVTMNVVGRLADRFSRLLVFRVMAVATMVPILILTNLPAGTSLIVTLIATTALMILSSARMVPATAMVTGAALPRYRGAFLSIKASVEQLGMAMAPIVGGALLTGGDDGTPLIGFGTVGLASVAVAGLSLVLAGWVRQAEEPRIAPELPPMVEAERQAG